MTTTKLFGGDYFYSFYTFPIIALKNHFSNTIYIIFLDK